mmetsp:Transcript_20214/g.28436  ORF Transcript_20214/g.28436 Transcript_20214/m.28436 type:complete len:150 (-) Transcript_20214:338-787(-)
MGLISILNEECLRPNGNDLSFVSKMKTMNKEIECLVNNPLHSPSEFAIVHYADTVKYEASCFVQKNTDKLPIDLLHCAYKSNNELIKNELKKAFETKSLSSGKRDKKGGNAVTTKFRYQLSKLMDNIEKTRTRYIRCIKPNPEKSSPTN